MWIERKLQGVPQAQSPVFLPVSTRTKTQASSREFPPFSILKVYQHWSAPSQDSHHYPGVGPHTEGPHVSHFWDHGAQDCQVQGSCNIQLPAATKSREERNSMKATQQGRTDRSQKTGFLALFCCCCWIYLFFNWRIITLQNCIGFCHISVWINHSYTHVPFLLNLPPTSHPVPHL